MPEKLLPAASKLTDEEIRHELHAAGTGDDRELSKIFNTPLVAAAARIERIVTDNFDLIRQAAAEEPLFSLPYSRLPPTIELPIPRQGPARQRYIQKQLANWNVRKLFAPYATPWFKSAIHDHANQEPDMDAWQEYTEAYQKFEAVHLNPSDAVINGLRWYHKNRFLHKIEQHYFKHQLTTRHADSLFRFSMTYPVRMPLYEGIPLDAQRLTQATGIVADLLYSDPTLKQAMLSSEALLLLKSRTLRANDPFFEQTEALSLPAIESLVRGILPMIVESSRFQAATSEEAMSLIVSNELPTKLARLAALGYPGPAAVYGVALEGDVTQQNDTTLQLTQKAIGHLTAMTTHINRYAHYPHLRKTQNALRRGLPMPMRHRVFSEGNTTPYMLNTGLRCPLRKNGEHPSAISALTEVLFLVYRMLKGYQTESIGVPKGYREMHNRAYARAAYEAKGLDLITAAHYQRLGMQVAKQSIVTNRA